jgi:hypothetical protein
MKPSRQKAFRPSSAERTGTEEPVALPGLAHYYYTTATQQQVRLYMDKHRTRTQNIGAMCRLYMAKKYIFPCALLGRQASPWNISLKHLNRNPDDDGFKNGTRLTDVLPQFTAFIASAGHTYMADIPTYTCLLLDVKKPKGIVLTYNWSLTMLPPYTIFLLPYLLTLHSFLPHLKVESFDNLFKLLLLKKKTVSDVGATKSLQDRLGTT